MSSPDIPNIDFGQPAIFFDSHPSEQDTYLWSFVTSLKTSFKIAWTGRVPRFLSPGQLRIIWHTHDGNQGMKDYELHEYVLVRENFDMLLKLEDVRRVVVMGYAGQNPYVMGPGGRNPWQDKFARQFRQMEREAKVARREQEKLGYEAGKEEKARAEKETYERQGNSKEARSGKVLDIEGVLDDYDRMLEEKLRVQREKHWKENDGLLSGEMV